MVIMQGPATTLPAKGIAKNCLIFIFATAVAVAMGWTGEDHYEFSGSWLQTNASDGGMTYSGTVDSHQWGSGTNTHANWHDWQTTTVTYPAAGGGGPPTVTVTSGSGSWSNTYSGPGYDDHVSNMDGGFRWNGGTATQVNTWKPANMTGVHPHVMPGTWSTPGTPPPAGRPGGRRRFNRFGNRQRLDVGHALRHGDARAVE